MLDISEYITEVERYQDDGDGYHNGYDKLEGDWVLYYKIARYFVHKVKFEDRQDFLHDLMLEMAKVKAKYEDRQDFLHDLILEMAKVKAKYEAKDKPLTEARLMRVASYELTDYWVKQGRITTWLDCGNCSKKQRRKCREELLYEQCPKFHQLVSLNTVVGDGDGHKTELMDFVADDKAVDLDAWLDARRCLQGMPRRLV